MINRMNDFNCFDEKSFIELESQLTKDKVYKTKLEAQANANKNTITTPVYNGYKNSNKKYDYQKAMSNKMFERVAWGEFRYSGYPGRMTNIDGKYSFDDGAIWKVIVGQDGKEYLVKEVVNDEIVRTASNKIYVTASNVRNIAEALDVFSVNDKTYSYLKDNNLLSNICLSVNKDLVNYVQDYMTKNYVESKEKRDEILAVVSKLGNQIDNTYDIDKIIKKVVER